MNNEFVVKIEVRRRSGHYYQREDTFEGSPETVTKILIDKYCDKPKGIARILNDTFAVAEAELDKLVEKERVKEKKVK